MMDNQQDGRVPAASGSREPSPAVSAASGFDPSRDVLTYVLALITEECAEATQLIGKALRFGFDTPGAPESPFLSRTVRQNLPKELGDIRASIRFAAAHGIVNYRDVQFYENQKFAKLMNRASRDNLGRQLAPQPSDSDGSPKGGDGEAGSVHDSSGPKDIAQTASDPHNG